MFGHCQCRVWLIMQLAPTLHCVNEKFVHSYFKMYFLFCYLTAEEVTCKQCSNTSHIVAKKKTGLLFLQLNGFQFHWYNRSVSCESLSQ